MNAKFLYLFIKFYMVVDLLRRKLILCLVILIGAFFLISININSIIDEKVLSQGGEKLFIKALPFSITNNGEFAAYANGGGTGSADDPWIIQNLDINASGEAAVGILIENTRDHFIIRNCTIYEMDFQYDGVKLLNVSNGCFTNNTIYNTVSGSQTGIYLDKSNHNNISFNNLHDLYYALKIENSSFNQFTHNSMYNHKTGIYMSMNSKNNTINHNTINLSKELVNQGILINTCDFNLINHNTISKFNQGISVQFSYYNNFSQNVIHENSLYGIFLHTSEKNDLCFNNTIYNCGDGIWSGGNETLIQNNNIFNNTKNGIYMPGYSQQLMDNMINNNSEEGVFIPGQNNSLQGNQIFNNQFNGINITGNKNNISYNNLTSNNLFGVFVSGDFNYFYRNFILENYDGTVSTQIGDTGINNNWIQNVLSYELDSDGDSITDYLEIFAYGTDPILTDTDNDGLNDNLELIYQTNPLDSDSDDDGYLDGIEIGRGTNPLNPLDNPLMRDIITIVLIATITSIIALLVIINVLFRKKVKKLEKQMIEFDKKKASSGGKARESSKLKNKDIKV
ncbi:MAG: hypothetical protein EAX96_09935 [Candidatus Lokiarchaeota archaeon]|nr:hypothetical protein [Candidatus Lokiarchaeota archaeon]